MRIRRTALPARGFSLVELMIGVALSLMIAAGLITVFVNNVQTRKEVERTSRQIENGRYAIELLSSNLRQAGFLGEFDPTQLTSPGAIPAACSAVTADVRSAMVFHIHGYRDATAATEGLSCLTDIKANSDVVVVRRASTCVAGTGACDSLTSGASWYMQASLCNPAAGNAELAGSVSDYYALDTDISKLTKHKRTCTTSGCDCTTPALADIRRYLTHIYYVANNNVGSDGVPTLKRAELDGNGFSTIVPLVEGIEVLRFEYGIDTNGDGIPEDYTATPDTYVCAGCNAVSNWRNIVTAKVFVLARNTETSAGYTDAKTYTLGSAAALPSFGDHYRRHVYGVTVKLVNVTGRRGI